MASRKAGSKGKAARSPTPAKGAGSAGPRKKGVAEKAGAEAPAPSPSPEAVTAAGAVRPEGPGDGAFGAAAPGESPTSPLTKDQTEAIGEMVTVVKALEATKTEGDARKAARSVHEKLDELDRALGAGHDLGDFIAHVGQGLAGAQKALDLESREYSARNPRHPTAYRVPRVQAELNLSFSSVTSRGVSFIVVNRKDETRTQTQRVSFEIVAAPMNAAFASVPLVELLVLDPEERESVRYRAQTYSASGAPGSGLLSPFLAAESLPGVLILRLAAGYALVRIDAATTPPRIDAVTAKATTDGPITAVDAATALALADLLPWLESTRRTQEALLRAG